MRASELFLELARAGPIPHGQEDSTYADLLAAYGFERHAWGWGLRKQAPILITAHLDTVKGRHPLRVNVHGGIAKGDGMLGGDDKAGVATVLALSLRDTRPGFALFFGEEVGCVGSTRASDELRPEVVVSVDRSGISEVIYAQLGKQTASHEAARWLAKQLGMGHKPSPDGIYTDSAVFAGVAYECMNLAAGYYGAHSDGDVQDLVYLDELVSALAQVDWANMPIVRGKEEIWMQGGSSFLC